MAVLLGPLTAEAVSIKHGLNLLKDLSIHDRLMSTRHLDAIPGDHAAAKFPSCNRFFAFGAMWAWLLPGGAHRVAQGTYIYCRTLAPPADWSTPEEL